MNIKTTQKQYLSDFRTKTGYLLYFGLASAYSSFSNILGTPVKPKLVTCFLCVLLAILGDTDQKDSLPPELCQGMHSDGIDIFFTLEDLFPFPHMTYLCKLRQIIQLRNTISPILIKKKHFIYKFNHKGKFYSDTH